MNNQTSTTDSAPIPITILTGFLGAGKTTLLNRILHGDHGLQIAVLVNDFGAVNIDSRLVVGVEDDTISLANGCICCTIRDDLLAATRRLLDRAQPPEYILVETSGVSDPASVARSFLLVGPRVRVDAILTVVDTEQIQSLEGQSMFLAMEQIGIADIVMLNKVDLVAPEQRETIRRWIHRMVPGARLLETVQAQAPLPLILGVGHYAPERLLQRQDLDVHVHVAPESPRATESPDAAISPDITESSEGSVARARLEQDTSGPFLPPHSHAPSADASEPHAPHPHHDHSLIFSTWTYESPHPLDVDLVQRAVNRLPTGIYRAKGLIHLAEPADRPGILQMVGRRARITAGTPWDSTAKLTQLVFIGEPGAIDPEALRTQFDACRPSTRTRLRNWVTDALDWVRGA